MFLFALGRTAEITCRIGLFALIWSVCGGLVCGVVVAVEFIFVVARTLLYVYVFDVATFDAGTIMLAINSVVVVPSEEMYAPGASYMTWRWFLYGWLEEAKDDWGFSCIGCFFHVFCCIGFVSCLIDATVCCAYYPPPHGFTTVSRICTSFVEFVVLIMYGLVAEDGQRRQFLIDADKGLGVFITSLICFFIFSQYLALIPKFALPYNVGSRSKWGYAYSGELTELKKMKLPKFPYTYKLMVEDDDGDRDVEEIIIYNKTDFWNEPCRPGAGTRYKSLTAAMFAKSKGNYDVVQWLGEQGADVHQDITEQEAIRRMDREWSDEEVEPGSWELSLRGKLSALSDEDEQEAVARMCRAILGELVEQIKETSIGDAEEANSNPPSGDDNDGSAEQEKQEETNADEEES